MNFTEYAKRVVRHLRSQELSPQVPSRLQKYSVEQKLVCVPKTEKDDVRNNKGGSKESKPANSPGFNVWGHTGVNGDGYAIFRLITGIQMLMTVLR